MNILQEIYAPRETVNDETVYITALHVKQGDFVTRDTLLVEIETSKAVFSIESECEGFVDLCCVEGEEVDIGKPLLYINESAIVSVEDAGSVELVEELPSYPLEETIFSRKALALIEAHQVSMSLFLQKDIVVSRDVLAVLEKTDVATPDTPHSPNITKEALLTLTEHDLVEIVPISRTKRTEIKYLSDIQASGLTSTVAVYVEAEEVLKALGHHTRYFSESLLPVLVYEISRLLLKYRVFNAFFRDNTIVYYQKVNVGVAVDIDKGLKVLTLHDSSCMDLPTIDSTIFELVDRYCENRLETSDTTSSTFTISDLSSYGIDFFLPLINTRQSAILGVSSADRKDKQVCLTLSFDHRVTDGKTASLFLVELKERLESYRAATSTDTSRKCAVCLKTLGEDARLSGAGLVQRVNHAGEIDLICTVCLRGLA